MGHFVGRKSFLCIKHIQHPCRLHHSEAARYLLHSAWVIQLQLGNDTARLQCCSSPLHIVNTTGLCSRKGHYHLHHLEFNKVQSLHLYNWNKSKGNLNRFHLSCGQNEHEIYLYFSITLARKHVSSILDCVLDKFSCWRRSQQRRIILPFKNASLVPNCDAIPVGKKDLVLTVPERLTCNN